MIKITEKMMSNQIQIFKRLFFCNLILLLVYFGSLSMPISLVGIGFVIWLMLTVTGVIRRRAKGLSSDSLAQHFFIFMFVNSLIGSGYNFLAEEYIIAYALIGLSWLSIDIAQSTRDERDTEKFLKDVRYNSSQN